MFYYAILIGLTFLEVVEYDTQEIRIKSEGCVLMNQNVNPTNPDTIHKFVDHLPTPRIARPKPNKNYPNTSYYELSMVQSRHRFHKNFPFIKSLPNLTYLKIPQLDP